MVDDDAILREAFAQLLNHESWLRVSRQFFSVGVVLAALEEERPPDIILLDLNLGNETGLSAIAPIRKLAPTVKVLMLTTFNDTHSEAEAFRLGASGFLLKLYDIQEIIALIHEAFYHPEDPRLFPNLSFDQRTKKHAVHLEPAPKKRSPFVTGLRQLFRPRKRQSAA